MPYDPMLDSREAFTAQEEDAYWEEGTEDFDPRDDGPEFEDDGQPSEYQEWQDYYGGDDWDHGQWDGTEEYDDYSNSFEDE